jgi:hypothetical protein
LYIIVRWQLVLAITQRAARMIAARRFRGDWDLIAITPIDMADWYRARVIMMLVLIWSGLFLPALLSSSVFLISLCIFALIPSSILAFGIEWLLFLPPLLLLTQHTKESFFLIYITLLIMYGLAFIVATLRLINHLSLQTIRQLDQPEMG